MFSKIPKKIEKIINTLEQNGYEAYIVGGCVRDILLGKTPYDYDITTNALPQDVKAIFGRTVDTGIKHGTVTVIEDGFTCEVTTYRTETQYSDARHPDGVVFVKSLKDDLARRDFTVNAICFNKRTGTVDLFGGTQDMKNKILRAVGNPEKRFNEDALRILRLFRFACALNFEIENETFEAAIKCAPLLSHVSAERIAAELIKSFCSEHPEKIEPLADCGGLEFIGIGKANGLEKTAHLKNDTAFRIFSSLSLCDCAISTVAEKLKLSNELKNEISVYEKYINADILPTESKIKHILKNTGEKIFFNILEYRKKVCLEDTEEAEKITQKIISEKQPYNLKSLDISGNDLVLLGLKGKEIGSALEYLLDAVIENPSLNQKEKLINLITK